MRRTLPVLTCLVILALPIALATSLRAETATQQDMNDARSERKELREEMQNIRTGYDSLHAEREQLQSTCGQAKGPISDSCKTQFAELKSKQDALHVRRAELRKKMEEEKLNHPVILDNHGSDSDERGSASPAASTPQSTSQSGPAASAK